MNNIIEYIESRIKDLKEKNDLKKYTKVSDTLKKVIGDKTPASDEDMDFIKEAFQKAFEDDYFSDSDKLSAKFITSVLLPKRKDLDDDQVILCNKIVKRLNELSLNYKNSEDELEIKKLEKLLKELRGSGLFTDFNFLVEVLREAGVDPRLQVSYLGELILRNYEYQRIKEKIANSPNSIDDISEVFSEYKIDFSKFEPSNKELLIKYASVDNIKEMLKYMNEKHILFYNAKVPTTEQYLAHVLTKSNVGVLEDLKDVCKQYGISFAEYLKKFPMVMIPKTEEKGKYKLTEKGPKVPVSECYQNFKEYVEYIDSKEDFLVSQVARKNPSLFIHNPNMIKRNWDILENRYGIKITEGSLQGICARSAQDVVDRYIEIFDSAGYSYIANNLSDIITSTNHLFADMKNAELNDNHLITMLPEGGIYKRKATAEDTKPEHEFVKVLLPDGKSEKYDKLDLNDDCEFAEGLAGNYYFLRLEDSYSESNILYRVGDTKVSRIKVIRILSNMYNHGINIGPDEVKYALGYNSLLSREERANIMDFENLYNKAKEKRVEEVDIYGAFGRNK